MADATGTSAQVRLVGMPTVGLAGPDGTLGAPEEAEFAASGQVITFPGFLRAYVEGSDDPEADLAEREVQLPPLAEGDTVAATALEPRSHTTQPPARYTEASLVKHLEELGVGRPSTYASILGTIQERGYVWKKGTALVPSFTAFAVVGLLEQYFGNLVDYGFTAAMEDDLDQIAQGPGRPCPGSRASTSATPALPVRPAPAPSMRQPTATGRPPATAPPTARSTAGARVRATATGGSRVRSPSTWGRSTPAR
jgi:DNA topoisomerase-1